MKSCIPAQRDIFLCHLCGVCVLLVLHRTFNVLITALNKEKKKLQATEFGHNLKDDVMTEACAATTAPPAGMLSKTHLTADLIHRHVSDCSGCGNNKSTVGLFW